MNIKVWYSFVCKKCKMDEFCGSRFWDSKLTWYTTDAPRFTQCFEKTVLVWMPCGFLFVCSIFEFLKYHQSKCREIPFGWLNISKLSCVTTLLSITILDTMYVMFLKSTLTRTYTVEYINAIIKITAFCLVIILMMKGKNYGKRTSATLFFFWLLIVLCVLPEYTRLVMMAYSNEQIHLYLYISQIIYCPILTTMLLLEFFVDSRPTFYLDLPTKNHARQDSVSFVNDLCLFWYDKFAFGHYHRKLEKTHLRALQYKDCLEYLVPKFYKHWWKQTESVNRRYILSKANYDKSKQLGGSQKSQNDFGSENKRNEISIMIVLWECFSSTYIWLLVLRLFIDFFLFVSPLILGFLIEFQQNDEPVWRGYVYMTGIVIESIIHSVVLNSHYLHARRLGLKIRSMLMAIIFRKVLKISNSAMKEFSVGDISNLMSVDTQRFIEFCVMINVVVTAPLICAACLYFLWQLMGISTLAGVILMLIIVLINGFAAAKIKELQKRQMKYKDKRLKITSELLSGIKTLKMYAWEFGFAEKITEIRAEEVTLLRSVAYISSAVSFIWVMTPYLVAVVTFAVFILVNENNILTTSIALVSLYLLSIMKSMISFIPRIVTSLTQTHVSTKRINKFLNLTELDIDAVTHHAKDYPLMIEEGSFAWNEENNKAVLHDINVKIKKGNLVAVIGRVGSGKSSLLNAFLGEMHKLRGRVNTGGSVAYVAQQAWIQNTTLQENILFMKPYNKSLYDEIVEACALIPDIQILPAGDLTEIGEKGVNVSGGQKQRISLARSVYNDADIYLMDDPLSAVDAHVGKHIFDRVIGPNGILKTKSRLLVTNSATYLPDVDYIVVMKNGTIVKSGTYLELVSTMEEFADYIMNSSPKQYSKEASKIVDLVDQDRKNKVFNDYSLSSNQFSTKIKKHASSGLIVGEKLIQEENIEEGQIKCAVYCHYLKSGGISFWLATILFHVIYQILSVAASVWLTEWSLNADVKVDNSTTDHTERYYYLEVYAIYNIAQVIVIVLATLIMYLATTKASTHLHMRMLEKILCWPTYVFDITPLGRILNKFSYDLEIVDNTFPMTINVVLVYGGAVFSTLYVISCSTPIFIICIIPIAIAYVILEQVYANITRQLQRLESASRTPLFTHFDESITGTCTIRAYNMENNFVAEAERRIRDYQICTLPNLQAKKWISIRLDSFGTLIIFLTILFAIVHRRANNAGIISLAITYALQVTGALGWFVPMVSEMEANLISIERIKDFENQPEEGLILPNYIKVPKTWPTKGVIVFDKYKTRHREGLDFVLHGIDIKIEGGEKIGIVGRSGAGKSSLTLSLFRIIEAAEGRIIIDGIDISQIELKVLRSKITIIPQDPVLFSGTVRLNLDPFFEYSDQELWRVLALAHLKELVSSLPLGLDFLISENGGNLSIGQRQLVCLARALLRKSKIVVLDEATAAIDLETDKLIQETISCEFKECTVLTIAHKINTIMNSDRIVVLDQGQVKEFETPANLLKSKTTMFYSVAKEAGIVP